MTTTRTENEEPHIYTDAELTEIMNYGRGRNPILGVGYFLFYVSPLGRYFNKPAHDLAIQLTKKAWIEA